MKITLLKETLISMYPIGFSTSAVTSLADLATPIVSKVQKLFQKLP